MKGKVKVWECRNCGHIVIGTNAPDVCPVCAHPQAYYDYGELDFQRIYDFCRDEYVWAIKIHPYISETRKGRKCIHLVFTYSGCCITLQTFLVFYETFHFI